MAVSQAALLREYIDCWLEQLDGDVSLTPQAERGMREQSVCLADVMSAIETGSVQASSKEEAQNAYFELSGCTIDGEAICLLISIDPNSTGMCVHRVTRP